MAMLSWSEIKKKYKDRWVAITQWEEDGHGDVVKGHVVYSNPHQNAFYDYINQRFANKDLAIRYTGNVQGPFFLDL